jgi:hypothetical protein
MPGQIRARARFAIASFTLALALSACGDDDPTDPGNQDIVGQWSYVITDATGGGSSCDVTGVTLTITRAGQELSGTIAAAGTNNGTCTQAGTGATAQITFNGTGPLENVALNGNSVAFTIPRAFTSPQLFGDWVSTGTLSGNSMSGDAAIVLRINGTVTDLDGTWTATRN